MKMGIRIVALALVVAQPLAAQRGGRGQQPPVRDTSLTRQTPQGPVMEFINTDVGVVMQAVAEAGGVNVQLSMAPSETVTLRLTLPLSREAAIETLKSLAEAHGMTITETPNILRFVGPPAPPTQQQLTLQQALAAQAAQQPRQLAVYTVRLRHASAIVLAPTLMNLLTGTGGIGGVTTAGRGGVNQGAAGGRGAQQGGRGGQQQGGRGGRGNQAAGAAGVAVPQVFIGGAQGGRGGANNPAAGIQAALAQAFGLQTGQTGANLAFTDTRIVAEEATNSLLVLATAEDFAVVQQLVQSVDLRPLQVLIEVTIAQVQRSADLNVGTSGVTTRRSTGDTTALLPSAASARDFIAQLTGGKGSIDYRVALNALQTRGSVRVLSLPVIIAQNNREAVLNVGSRVPFVQVAQTTGLDPTGRVETIQYQDVGTTLTITPIINSDGYVNLAVQQTNDDLTSNLLFDAPIINSRQATTSVFVRDGQTTVVGGLADNTSNNSTSGIPFLSRIPFVGGWLFGNQRRNDTANELYLFLTPHIISSDEDIDRLRESVRSGSGLLQGIPVQGRINPGGDTLQIGVRDTVRRVPPDTGRQLPPIPPDSLRERMPLWPRPDAQR